MNSQRIAKLTMKLSDEFAKFAGSLKVQGQNLEIDVVSNLNANEAQDLQKIIDGIEPGLSYTVANVGGPTIAH